MRQAFGLSHAAVRPVEEAVREALYNAVDWAGGGTVQVQSESGGCLVLVSDTGPGIGHTMSRVMPGLQEMDALLKAIQPGVSSSGDSFRGCGLWSVANASRYGVSVRVETDGAGVVFGDGSPQAYSRTTSGSGGVLVWMSWPA